jgi:hypothetical protein
MSSKNILRALALSLSSLILSPALNAAIIDFESAAVGGCQVTAGGSIDGFSLSANNGGFNDSTACGFIAPTANSGSQYMVNYNSRIAEFTRDVGTFTLNSLFVHADSRVGASTVRFQGLDGIGGAVLQSLEVNINSAWQQVSFAGWTNIKTFTWDSLNPGTSNIAIDDFEFNSVSDGDNGGPVASVPDPSTLGTLSLGLLGLAFVRRKQTT